MFQVFLQIPFVRTYQQKRGKGEKRRIERKKERKKASFVGMPFVRRVKRQKKGRQNEKKKSTKEEQKDKEKKDKR